MSDTLMFIVLLNLKMIGLMNYILSVINIKKLQNYSVKLLMDI